MLDLTMVMIGTLTQINRIDVPDVVYPSSSSSVLTKLNPRAQNLSRRTCFGHVLDIKL